jgi:hypothetical protein
MADSFRFPKLPGVISEPKIDSLTYTDKQTDYCAEKFNRF